MKELAQDETLRTKIDVQKYATDSVGLPTLNDIMSELSKPGRDPRDTFEMFSYEEGIDTLKELQKEHQAAPPLPSGGGASLAAAFFL